MKTITMYELLGMVKDGKASDITTNFMFDRKKYNLLAFLDEYTLDINSLNWEIEILEEEKKIPEKIDMFDYFTGYDFSGTDKDLLKHLETNFETINKSINEIIDYLKSKGDE